MADRVSVWLVTFCLSAGFFCLGAVPLCPIDPPCECHWDYQGAEPDHALFCRNRKLSESTLSDIHYAINVTFRTVDLSVNNIEDLPRDYLQYIEEDVERMFLNNNSLRTIPVAVRHLLNLKYLDLHKNKIEQLHGYHFTMLTQLTTLILSDNQFQKITDSTFQHLANLELLNLANNVISSIELNSFANLAALLYLDLSLNELSALHVDYFAGLTNIIHLDLNSNSLVELPSKIFNQMPNMRTLLLGYNDIRTMEMDSFEGLGNLTYLDLSFNRIRSLPDDLFKPMTALQELDLSYNYIKTMNPESFSQPSDIIIKLVLTDNNIQKFQPKFFDLFPNLKYLLLGQEKLYFLPDVRNLKKLKGLSMSYSRISRVYPCELPQIMSMKSVTWRDSPIACDCHLRWLRSWYDSHLSTNQKSFIEEYSPWICDYPENVKGKYFSDIPVEDFICENGVEAKWCRDTVKYHVPNLFLQANSTQSGIQAIWSVQNVTHQGYIAQVRLTWKPTYDSGVVNYLLFDGLSDGNAIVQTEPATEYLVCVESLAAFNVVMSSQCTTLTSLPAQLPTSAPPGVGMWLPWVIILVLGACSAAAALYYLRLRRSRKETRQDATDASTIRGIENAVYDLQPLPSINPDLRVTMDMSKDSVIIEDATNTPDRRDRLPNDKQDQQSIEELDNTPEQNDHLETTDA